MKELLIQLEIEKFKAFVSLIQLRAHGCIAANQMHQLAGQLPLHSEASFLHLADRINQAIATLNDRIKRIMETPTPNMGEADLVSQASEGEKPPTTSSVG